MQEMSNLTFNFKKKEKLKHSQCHITEQQAHTSFSKRGVVISSLSNIQVNERTQLYFNCW